MEKASRDVEINITRKIEEYQEQVNDLQRVIELAFERPIAEINAENAIMSEDMNIMNHAAEEINKRYDEQAEALQKVSDIKSQLVEKEKEQLDLADALSKGDIGAAARAIQAMRASQAARNAENASKALELSRKNKIDNLRGEVSGLSKEEITERQYQNAKTIYALENTATTEVNGKLMTRLEILKQIQDLNDDIYAKEEDREAAQLKIRGMEDEIYKINQEKIKPKQKQIDAQSIQIAKDEDALQTLVENITVLGKTKDVWDGITAKIEASSLAGSDFDRLMGGMLASVDKIDEGWKSIENTMAKYSSATAMGPDTAMGKQRTDMLTEYNKNTGDSKALIDGAKAKIALAQEEYEIAKKKYDLELESMKAQLEAAKARNDYKTAGMINSSIVAHVKKGPPVAPVSGPSRAADNANVNYNDTTQNAAQDIYDEANAEAKGSKQLYTYKGPGGASVDPGSGGSTTKAPGGTTTKAPGGTTTKAPGGTTTKAPGGTTTKAPAPPKMTNLDKATIALGTDDKMKNLEKTAKTQEEYALNVLKNRYGTSDKNSDTYRKLTGKKRIEFDKDYADYQAKKKTAESFNLSPTGGGGGYDPEYSLGAHNARTALLKKLPKWVQDAVELIDRRKELEDVDYPKLRPLAIKLSEAKDEMNIGDNWTSKQIEEYKPFMDKYGDLFRQHKSVLAEIQDKNNATDLARNNLLNAGYNKENFEWAFKRWGNSNHPNIAPFSNSTKKDFRPGTPGSTQYYATGGLVSSRFAQKKFSMGTDTVPAMLTPGEFVMNKFAVQSQGIGKMQAINNGQPAGDAVYNYSISVNVRSESNPDEIARTVIAQIKSVDAQKMRGVRT
jgi:hypothetical protein